jgi:hypothetical protein
MEKLLVRLQPIIAIDFGESVPTNVILDGKQSKKAGEPQIQSDAKNYKILLSLLHNRNRSGLTKKAEPRGNCGVARRQPSRTK